MRELKGLCRYWPGETVMQGKEEMTVHAAKVIWDPMAEVRGGARVVYDIMRYGGIIGISNLQTDVPEEDLHPVRRMRR